MATHSAWRIVITANNGEDVASLQSLQLMFNGVDQSTGNSGTDFNQNVLLNDPQYGAVRAFNTSNGTVTFSLNPAVYPCIMGRIFSSPFDMDEHIITAGTVVLDRTVNTWTIEYSDDTTTGFDGTWVEADSISNESGWSALEVRSFPLASGPVSVGTLAVTEDSTDTILTTVATVPGAKGVPITAKAWRIEISDNGGDSQVGIELLSLRSGTSDQSSFSPGTDFNQNALSPAAGAINLFDGLNSLTTPALSAATAVYPVVFGRIFDSPLTVDNYLVMAPQNNYDRMATAWKLEYSNDTTDGVDGNWIIWDQQSNRPVVLGLHSTIYSPGVTTSGDLAFTETGGPDTLRIITPNLKAFEAQNDTMLAGNIASGLSAHTGWRIRVTENNGTGLSANLTGTHTFNLYSGIDNLSQNTGTPFSNVPESVGLEPANAFDTDTNTQFSASIDVSPVAPLFLGKIFDTPIIVDRYYLGDYGDYSGSTDDPLHSFRDWAIEYSDNSTDGINGNWLPISNELSESNWYTGEVRRYFAVPINRLLVKEPSDLFASRSSVNLQTLLTIQQNILCEFSSDNLVPVTVPVSLMSLRLKRDGVSSVDMTVPDGKQYQDIIQAFKDDNGSFRFTYIDVLEDGTIETSQSESFDLVSAASSRGGRNWSITVRGELTVTLADQYSIIPIDNVSLLTTNANGSFSIRAKLDRRLLPNDIAVYEGVDYYVDNITQVYRENDITMQIFTN